MTPFITNIRSAFGADAASDKRDSGEFVSQIVMIAGFTMITMLLVNWLGTSVLNKAADVATCVETSNSYGKGDAKACNDTSHAKANSFKKDAGYTGRMGAGG